jgi:hypothetical protein
MQEPQSVRWRGLRRGNATQRTREKYRNAGTAKRPLAWSSQRECNAEDAEKYRNAGNAERPLARTAQRECDAEDAEGDRESFDESGVFV